MVLLTFVVEFYEVFTFTFVIYLENHQKCDIIPCPHPQIITFCVPTLPIIYKTLNMYQCCIPIKSGVVSIYISILLILKEGEA